MSNVDGGVFSSAFPQPKLIHISLTLFQLPFITSRLLVFGIRVMV